jgi:uncharacterized protein
MDGVPFLLGAIAFGVVTGILSGLLGIGGGLFMVPFLVLVGGAAQQEAQATSLLVILPTAVVATWSLQRAGIGDLRLSLRMGLVGIFGSVAGATLALALPGSVLRLIFAAVLALVGLRLLRDATSRSAPQGP